MEWLGARSLSNTSIRLASFERRSLEFSQPLRNRSGLGWASAPVRAWSVYGVRVSAWDGQWRKRMPRRFGGCEMRANHGARSPVRLAYRGGRARKFAEWQRQRLPVKDQKSDSRETQDEFYF